MSSWPFRLAEKRLDGGEMCVRFSRREGALAEKWRRHANSGRIDDRPRGRGINEQFSPCFADAVKPTRGSSPPLAGKAEKSALAARGGGGDSAFRPET
jgi:hypothetical protein